MLKLPASVETEINNVVAEALILQIKAHVWHLSTTVPEFGAKHACFEELYNTFGDIADSISEKAQGFGVVLPVELLPNELVWTRDTSYLEEVSNFLEKLENLEDLLDAANVEWLGNVIQDAQGKLYGVLYKLNKVF